MEYKTYLLQVLHIIGNIIFQKEKESILNSDNKVRMPSEMSGRNEVRHEGQWVNIETGV